MGLKPVVNTVTVTTAGTRVQVSATSQYAYKVRFESVAGTIFVGDSTVSSLKYMTKLTAGNAVELTGYIQGGPNAGSFQLSSFYLDSVGSADKCQVTYFEREGNG